MRLLPLTRNISFSWGAGCGRIVSRCSISITITVAVLQTTDYTPSWTLQDFFVCICYLSQPKIQLRCQLFHKGLVKARQGTTSFLFVCFMFFVGLLVFFVPGHVRGVTDSAETRILLWLKQIRATFSNRTRTSWQMRLMNQHQNTRREDLATLYILPFILMFNVKWGNCSHWCR